MWGLRRLSTWAAFPVVVPMLASCHFAHQINCVPDKLTVPPARATDPTALVLSPTLTTKSGGAKDARLVMFLESRDGNVVDSVGAYTDADGRGHARLNYAQMGNELQLRRLMTVAKYEVRFSPTEQESHGQKPLCDAHGSAAVTFTSAG